MDIMEENKEGKKMEIEEEETKKETPKKEKAPAKKTTTVSKEKEVEAEMPKKAEAKSEEKPKQAKTDKKAEKVVTPEKEVKKEVKNDDLTFKKVQGNGSSKKKIDEMQNKGKKNHSIAKAILILIMIFIAAYCVFFARNLIILNSIANKVEENKDTTNYAYMSVYKYNTGVNETRIQYYKKDNIERFDFQRDNVNLIWWYDSDTNEKIIAIPENRKATISNVDDFEVVHLPIEEIITTKETMAYMSLISFIYSEEYNSKDCYVIETGASKKTWIDKETGLIVKREYPDHTVEYIDVSLDYQNEIYKPDLTGYEIQYDANIEQ